MLLYVDYYAIQWSNLSLTIHVILGTQTYIKKLKMRSQVAQNKCTRFCLKLNDRSSIKSKDFEKINWLPIHKRVSQCSLCSVYKLFTKSCPNCFVEM